MEKTRHERPYIALLEDDEDDVLIITEAFTQCYAHCDFYAFSDEKKLLAFVDKKKYPPAVILIHLHHHRDTRFNILPRLRENKAIAEAKLILYSSGHISDEELKGNNIELLKKPNSYQDAIMLANSLIEKYCHPVSV